ncbi:MAG: hypothetical protein WBH40_08325 [Ignavibacteriaceae bacterium]
MTAYSGKPFAEGISSGKKVETDYNSFVNTGINPGVNGIKVLILNCFNSL